MRLGYSTLAAVFAVLIVILAALPTATKHALHTQGVLHPYLHLFGFAVLAVLLLRASSSAVWRLLCILLLFGLAYGTEALESRNDGWPIEQRDVLTDSMGVLAGAIVSFGLEGARGKE